VDCETVKVTVTEGRIYRCNITDNLILPKLSIIFGKIFNFHYLSIQHCDI
jgi:hypothetical protein